MKTLRFCISVLIACLLITTSCKKKEAVVPEPAPAPDPYTYNADLQSSKDISMATFAISDIDMMCAFLGGRIPYSFYSNDPSVTSSGTATSIVDSSSALQMVFSFNNTSCADGRYRNGSVFFSCAYDASTNPLAKPEGNRYYHYGFSAAVYLSEYKVNGWKIELFDPTKPAHITCMLITSSYNPAQTNLSWRIVGKFRFLNPTDTSKDIVWDGEIVKTLKNTNDPAVFASDKSSSIYWPKANVNYTGVVTGSTSGNVPFTYTIDNTNPLVRNFPLCGSGPAGTTLGINQVHPFNSGSATFVTSNYHPRTINYSPAHDCDNKGTVSFHGETYNVDFD